MIMLPRIDEIDNWMVDACVKGFPPDSPPLPLAGISRRGWRLFDGDLPLPVAVLRAEAVSHNRRWMRRFLEVSGVSLAPHGKTTMSPQLMAAQVEDGAWGLTCATVGHLQVYARFGFRRVLIANQVAGVNNLRALAETIARYPDVEVYVLVDSPVGVEQLAAAAKAAGLDRPIRVLIEVGQTGVRTGARDLAAVDTILAALDEAQPRLALHGVECYEGAIKAPPGEVEERAVQLLDLLLATARRCVTSPAAAAAGEFLLSAGGSELFDLVAHRLAGEDIGRSCRVVLRSGCYLTHDHLTYARAFDRIQARGLHREPALECGLRPALEVWGCVQSRPEASRAYVSAGKRDISFDFELPVPTFWFRPGRDQRPVAMPAGVTTIALNDQHAHLEVRDGTDLQVGDLVGFGIAHPCTTFDKWRLIYVVDEDYRVVDAIRTYF